MPVSVPPKRVVIAVDFGAASAAAVTLAGRIAKHFGASLLAVHAETVDVPPYFTREQMDRLDQEVQAARRLAEAEVRSFVEARTSVPFDVRVVEQPAAEAILDAIPAADLVVMGTHGRRGPRRWWLGSVAERVVRSAEVPVLVVHDGGEPASRASFNPTLLAAPEMDATSTRAWAAALADALGGVVEEGPSPDQCSTDGVSANSLVVVPMPAHPANRSVHENVVALARKCTVPVLFVPVGR